LAITDLFGILTTSPYKYLFELVLICC
jgi:hypothetical protein